METKAFYQYLPTRYEADKKQWSVRNLIWEFKKGNRSSIVAQLVASYLRKTYGAEVKNLFVRLHTSQQRSKDRGEI